MLGPIGKTAKAALTRAGYELTRPTAHERQLLRSFWADWLSKDPVRFGQVYRVNRDYLRTVDRWFTPESLVDSLWRYGVPPQWDARQDSMNATGLNDIELEVTYTDLIAVMASRLDNLRYLEIGVSVGKNFMQIVKQFPDAEIFGLDVEDLNPRIAQEFERVETVWQSDRAYAVETLSGHPARIRLAIQKLHRKDGRPVTYIKGDQFSPDTWAALKGNKFNFIFSDGVHSPRALLDEMDHISRNELIAEGPFTMYWDDLVNVGMQDAFKSNCETLAQICSAESDYGLHWIHGTYGARRLNGWFASS